MGSGVGVRVNLIRWKCGRGPARRGRLTVGKVVITIASNYLDGAPFSKTIRSSKKSISFSLAFVRNHFDETISCSPFTLNRLVLLTDMNDYKTLTTARDSRTIRRGAGIPTPCPPDATRRHASARQTPHYLPQLRSSAHQCGYVALLYDCQRRTFVGPFEMRLLFFFESSSLSSTTLFLRSDCKEENINGVFKQK